MSAITIFAPSPVLTVTLEEGEGDSAIHIHAGGQGVWQARMLLRLGVEVWMTCVLSGETGQVMRHLLDDEGIRVDAVQREARGAAYVHDRRNGERVELAMDEGTPLGRHELDELYGLTLKRGIETGLAILSGPAGDDALPADTYRRLASDLRAGGAKVIVDLAGDRLEAAVEGGVDVLKVSHEELQDDGLISQASVGQIAGAMRELRDRGAECVIVTRASEPLLLLDSQGLIEVTAPRMEIVDTRGAGDSLTAGVAAGMAQGASPREAVTLGAAAGALNVTRHGLGTGDADAIEALRRSVTVRDLAALIDNPEAGPAERVDLDGLAALADPHQDAQEDGTAS